MTEGSIAASRVPCGSFRFTDEEIAEWERGLASTLGVAQPPGFPHGDSLPIDPLTIDPLTVDPLTVDPLTVDPLTVVPLTVIPVFHSKGQERIT